MRGAWRAKAESRGANTQGTNDSLGRGTSTGTVKRKENTRALKELDSAGWAIGLTLERQ